MESCSVPWFQYTIYLAKNIGDIRQYVRKLICLYVARVWNEITKYEAYVVDCMYSKKFFNQVSPASLGIAHVLVCAVQELKKTTNRKDALGLQKLLHGGRGMRVISTSGHNPIFFAPLSQSLESPLAAGSKSFRLI
jgi:hypothetical protein